jgi:hypothetical protein
MAAVFVTAQEAASSALPMNNVGTTTTNAHVLAAKTEDAVLSQSPMERRALAARAGRDNVR